MAETQDYSTSKFENALAEKTYEIWLDDVAAAREIFDGGDEVRYALVDIADDASGQTNEFVLLHLHSSGAVYVEAEGSAAEERYNALLREYDHE